MDLPRLGGKFNPMFDSSEGGAMAEFHVCVKEDHSCHSVIGILRVMGPNKTDVKVRCGLGLAASH